MGVAFLAVSVGLIVTIVVVVMFIVHQDGRSVLLQYSHWQNGEPSLTETNMCTVVAGASNEWLSRACNERLRYVCQSRFSPALAVDNIPCLIKNVPNYHSLWVCQLSHDFNEN